MFFVELNVNPKQRNIQDCVVRAISLAMNKDYNLTYQELVNWSIQQGEGWLFNYRQSYGNYLVCHGCEVHMPFKIGRRKARVYDLYNHPKFSNGTYVVLLKGHLTVVTGNHLYDTWDCSNKIIELIWEVKDI